MDQFYKPSQKNLEHFRFFARAMQVHLPPCPLAVLLKGAFWDIQAHHALSCSAQLLLPGYHTVTHIDRNVPYHTVS